MTADWEIGNLAECIDDDWGDENDDIRLPIMGGQYIVSAVDGPAFCLGCRQETVELALVGFPQNCG